MSYLSSHLDMYKNSSKGVESSCTAINVESAFTITNKKDTIIEEFDFSLVPSYVVLMLSYENNTSSQLY